MIFLARYAYNLMYLIFKHALNISERKYQTFHLELNKKLWSNLIKINKADLNWSTIIYSYHNFLCDLRSLQQTEDRFL